MKNLYLSCALCCSIFCSFAFTVIDIKPLPNVMAIEKEDPRRVNLEEYFSSADSLFYSVKVNSNPSVVSSEINDTILVLNFISPGQSNIVIEATSDSDTIIQAFVVGVQPVITGEYVVSEFTNLTLETNGYWNGADGSGGFASGLIYFPNNYNAAWGAWKGWSYSGVSDNTTPGYGNQHSSITSNIEAGNIKNNIYAIAYSPEALKFSTPSAHQVKGFFLSNSTYGALAMKYGSDFNRKFGGSEGELPDWYKLTVWGMVKGVETASKEFYLADFRFEDNNEDYIIETWQWLELSDLGKVDSLMFSLSSSDMSEWGMNNPEYFSLTHVYVVPDKAPVINNPVSNIKFPINTIPAPISLAGVFTDEDDDNSDIQVSIKNISLPSLLTAEITNDTLWLNIASDMTGTSEITLEALSNGKTAEHSFNVTVEFASAVPEDVLTDYTIYPNPAIDNISITRATAGSATVEIFTFSGNKLYSGNLTGQTEIINVDFLPPGVYIIRISNKDQIVTSRIVIQ